MTFSTDIVRWLKPFGAEEIGLGAEEIGLGPIGFEVTW